MTYALSRRFPRQRAFITGAASGLGQALAMELARDGWNLCLVDLAGPRLEETAQQARQAGARTVYTRVLDVTNREQYASVVEEWLGVLGGMDVVINNAGVAVCGLVGELDPADWDWLMGINLTGVMNGCHLFVDALKRQKSGHIINISSASALLPAPRMGAYSAAKAGVRAFSEVLYGELRSHGVGVSVVMPEFFRTNLGETARGPDTSKAVYLLDHARFTPQQVAQVALRGAGRNMLHVVFPLWVRAAWVMLRAAPQAGLRAVSMVEKIVSGRMLRKAKKRSGAAADTAAQPAATPAAAANNAGTSNGANA